jgi:glycosyltransferase involved in cell wall biosynthesis
MQDHTRSLALGLARAGHEAEVITARHPEGLPEERLDGVRWRYVDARPARHLDRGWMVESYREFARAQHEAPFDVVHGQGSSALELLRRGVHRSVPMVTMFHGNFLNHARASLGRALASARPQPVLRELKGLVVLAARDHFRYGNWYRFRDTEAIVPSQAQLVETCRSHLLHRSRTHVVPNGVDVELFRPRPRTELRAELGLGDEPLFVCVGRLNRGKGTHNALEALAKLRNGASATRLAVVGDGLEREPLEALAGRLGLSGRVLFTGAQPPERVAEYLAAADGFLFPTAFAEAAPLVLLQAMASGLPVVASELGAIPEVVGRDRSRGVLVRAGDVGGLASELDLLVRDEKLRERLGAAARESAVAEYSLERMVEQTVAVYELAASRLGTAA